MNLTFPTKRSPISCKQEKKTGRHPKLYSKQKHTHLAQFDNFWVGLNVLRKGPFKCYVTQMGVGGVFDFLGKNVTTV